MSGTGPHSVAQVRLRPATDHDWPGIRRWLAQPEVIRWLGPKATSEAEVMLAMSTPQAICRIIEARLGGAEDWEEAGYGHAFDASLRGEELPAQIAAGTWQIDLFVAKQRFRGRGVGARTLELLRDEVFATTLCLTACVCVGVGNEKAVRAYEKAGFRWRAVTHDATKGPQWLMTAERGPADPPVRP